MIVYNNFDAQNLLFICLQISPQIFAILQNFPINNLRDQQFCTLLCELEWPVVVLFTGLALEVEVPPGMVCMCNVNGDPSLCLSLFLLLQFISWSALFQNATLNKPKQTKLSDVTKEIIVWIHTIQYCAGVCIRSAGGGSICCGSIHYININHRRPDCVASVGGEANLAPRDSLCGSGRCLHSYC